MRTIDPSLLALVMGGKKDDDDDRTPRQIVRDYVKACAGGGLMGGLFGGGEGRMSKKRAFALACGLGIVGQGADDLAEWAFQERKAEKKPAGVQIVE